MQASKTLFQSILWRGLYYVTVFIINILIARHFQAATSGSIYYISSIYSFILLFVSFSIESGITYFVASEKIAANKLFGFAIFWSLITGVIIFLFLSFFTNFIYNGFDYWFLFISSITAALMSGYCLFHP